jgi:hypothetical protein
LLGADCRVCPGDTDCQLVSVPQLAICAFLDDNSVPVRSIRTLELVNPESSSKKSFIQKLSGTLFSFQEDGNFLSFQITLKVGWTGGLSAQ